MIERRTLLERLQAPFVALASAASFALFLGRALVQLDPGRAVPKRVNSAFDLFSAGVIIRGGHHP